MKHKSVLTKEVVSGLDLKPDSVVVDATLGSGGHAREILSKLDSRGVYVGIDADPVAIEKLEILTDEFDSTVHLVNDNFSSIKSVVENLNVKPDAILADLGWRTDQFEEGGKGFSFTSSDPLLMTYGHESDYTFTAKDIVNEWEESSIADVIYGYGEERFSRRIAKAIVEARVKEPITTASQLAKIVEEATPFFYRRGKINPATKTFQALRIAVNDELGVLNTLLKDGFAVLEESGVFAIISFHSLEDRLVKTYFNQLATEGIAKKLTKKPTVASSEEIKANPRARSAKLRIIKKLNPN